MPEDWSRYSLEDGVIVSNHSGTVPTETETCGWIPGHYPPGKMRLNLETREIEETPPPTAEVVLVEWRNGTYLSKAQLAANLLKAKILTKREAVGLASGRETPAVVTRAIARLDPALQDEAELLLLGTVTVWRMSPVILALAAEGGLTDAALDKLFGTPPAPQALGGKRNLKGTRK